MEPRDVVASAAVMALTVGAGFILDANVKGGRLASLWVGNDRCV